VSDYYRPSGFGGFSFFPPVIKNLLIINGVVFLIQILGEKIAASSGLTLSNILTKYFALMLTFGISKTVGVGKSYWKGTASLVLKLPGCTEGGSKV